MLNRLLFVLTNFRKGREMFNLYRVVKLDLKCACGFSISCEESSYRKVMAIPKKEGWKIVKSRKTDTVTVVCPLCLEATAKEKEATRNEIKTLRSELKVKFETYRARLKELLNGKIINRD